MAYGHIPRDLMAVLLAGDGNDRRFEKFCADLFSLRDGVHYETTAPTGDTGVDAEAQGSLTTGICRILATTQSKGHRRKGQEDIDKTVGERRTIARLHVCFSKDVEEAVLKDLKHYAAEKLPRAEMVEVHGLSGISDLAFRYQRAFTDNYARDLDLHTLSYQSVVDREEDDNHVDLLRIAISTVFHPEIQKQRQLLMENSVLLALSENVPRSLDEVTRRVATGLKLTPPPHRAYLVPAVETLTTQMFIKRSHAGLTLAGKGASARDSLVLEGAKSSLDGRATFERILELSDEKLAANDLTKLWRFIQDNLAVLFCQNGLRVVSEIREILASGEKSSDKPIGVGLLQATLQKLLSDLGSLGLSGRVSIAAARILGEMFRDQASEGFQWLSRLAVKYVVMCSLGLDPEFEARIRQRVSRWTIIPDTHVILSYLCEGDEGHEACEAVLKQLRRLNAVVWAMESVVEESVHHAEIADPSFYEWNERVRLAQREGGDIAAVHLLEATDNAFVKGFAAQAGGVIRVKDWRAYIAQFRGAYRKDASRLAEILKDELDAVFKGDTQEIREAGRAFARDVLRDASSEETAATLRCEWDGRLLVSCVIEARGVALGDQLVIISSDDRLRRFLDEKVAADRRGRIRVTDAASIAWALAAVPGTWVNLNSVRHLLFADGLRLPAHVQATNLLVQAFSTPTRFLRRASLNETLNDRLIGVRPEYPADDGG